MITYENSLDAENNTQQKIVTIPQYVDPNILRRMINPRTSTGSQIDENYYDFANDNCDEDGDERDESQIGLSEIIHNMNLQENLDFDDIQQPFYPNEIQKHILASY